MVCVHIYTHTYADTHFSYIKFQKLNDLPQAEAPLLNINL